MRLAARPPRRLLLSAERRDRENFSVTQSPRFNIQHDYYRYVRIISNRSSAPINLLQGLEARIEPFFHRILNNMTESLTLFAALRDTLLPKLISGEVRVPDVERFAETVAVHSQLFCGKPEG